MSSFTPDKIYCVIMGLDDGTIQAIGGPFGANWVQVHDASRPARIRVPGGLKPEDITAFQDTLKVTQLRGEVTVTIEGDIDGCTEDPIDVTRCVGQILIEWTGVARPTGKHLAIVKGESNGVTLRGKVVGHGRDTDVELGGYYGGGTLPNLNGKTINTTLDLTCADTLKLSQFSATAPRIANTQAYKHDRFNELVYPLWLWFRERGIGK